LTERNGTQSIRMSNPDALVAYCSSAKDVRDFMIAVMNGLLEERGCKTLVVDSLTEIQRLFADEIKNKKPEGVGMTIADWGTLTEKMRRFLRVVRDLNVHVVCTALAEHQLEEVTGENRLYPAFQGKKLPNEVAQYFNIVGYAFKRLGTAESENGTQNKRTIEHKIMVDGPSKYLVKGCDPVRGILDPNICAWSREFEQFSNQEGAENGKD